jgi:hypothetical protein
MAEILMIIRMQFTAGVKLDFVEHASEVPQTDDCLVSAFRENLHLRKTAR